MALGRSHHSRTPAHDVVAGEDGAVADERITKMVGRVPRRVDRIESPTCPLDHIAAAQRLIWREGAVDEIVAYGVCFGEATGRLGGTIAQDARAGFLFQRFDQVRMVAVSVGEENMGDSLAFERVQQGVEMGRIVGAGIDDRDLAPAYHIGIGAHEGERTRIVGHQTADSGSDLAQHAVLEVHGAVEGKIGRGGLGIFELSHRSLGWELINSYDSARSSRIRARVCERRGGRSGRI